MHVCVFSHFDKEADNSTQLSAESVRKFIWKMKDNLLGSLETFPTIANWSASSTLVYI